MGPAGCRALGDGLGKLLQLTIILLNVCYNDSGGGGREALGDGLCKLPKLTDLKLYLKDCVDTRDLSEKLQHVPEKMTKSNCPKR